MKNITLAKLKMLTPKKCVELATFLFPEHKWQHEVSANNPWDGHDVVVRDKNDNLLYCLQIDYREQVNQQWARVRIYTDETGLVEPVKEQKVRAFFNK